MIQALMINGTEVRYSIETGNIRAVLGRPRFRAGVACADMLRIIYLGLRDRGGYSFQGFAEAVLKGDIYASRPRGHCPFPAVRRRVAARIRQAGKASAAASPL